MKQNEAPFFFFFSRLLLKRSKIRFSREDEQEAVVKKKSIAGMEAIPSSQILDMKEYVPGGNRKGHPWRN